MAARTRKVRCDDFTRDRIRTTQLVKRLEDHAFGDVQLEQSQVNAINILLRKSLPDLSTVTVEGNKDKPLQVVERRIVDPKHSDS
jgi:hypothetical protein